MRTGMSEVDEDVDDASAHRELALVLHLVLAPIAEGYEPAHELALVEDGTRADPNGDRGLAHGAESLEQGAYWSHDHTWRLGNRATIDASATRLAGPEESSEAVMPSRHSHGVVGPSSRSRGYALEGKRVPRREQRDRLLTQVRGQLPRQALCIREHRRHYEQRPAVRERAQPRQRERGGRLGHRQRAVTRPHGLEHGGLVAEQRWERAEAHRFTLRVQC